MLMVPLMMVFVVFALRIFYIRSVSRAYILLLMLVMMVMFVVMFFGIFNLSGVSRAQILMLMLMSVVFMFMVMFFGIFDLGVISCAHTLMLMLVIVMMFVVMTLIDRLKKVSPDPPENKLKGWLRIYFSSDVPAGKIATRDLRGDI